MGTDWIKTADKVEEMTRAAGSGDFSRVAFEYSPEINRTGGDNGFSMLFCVVAKFIAAKTGIYRYTFDLKYGKISGSDTESQNYTFYIDRKLYAAPLSKNTYYNGSKTVTGLNAQDNVNNFSKIVVGELMSASAPYTDTILSQEKILHTTFKTVQTLFYASEGSPIVFHATVSSGDYFDKNCSFFSIKNQKITY